MKDTNKKAMKNKLQEIKEKGWGKVAILKGERLYYICSLDGINFEIAICYSNRFNPGGRNMVIKTLRNKSLEYAEKYL